LGIWTISLDIHPAVLKPSKDFTSKPIIKNSFPLQFA
jgi:hypothetical protein